MAIIDQVSDSHISLITLSQSDKGNLLNSESLNAIYQAVNNAVNDKDTRVIVLRSNGPVFCLGMDLVSLQSRKDNKEVENALLYYVKACAAIFDSPKPVIALVQGDVKAGGVGLASACDIVLATEQASFELGEVLFGILPANVLPYVLGYRLSFQKARYLVLTSKKIGPQEALRIGLVDEVIPADKLEKEAKKLIKRLLRSSPNALAEAKSFTKEISHKTPDQVREAAKDKLLSLVQLPEVIEGVASFNSGDVPEWFASYRPEKTLLLTNQED